jgi:hypothetical protein
LRANDFHLSWVSFLAYDVLPSSIAIVGLYGYVYSKKFGVAIFWKAFFVFVIVSFMAGVFNDLSFAKELSANLNLEFNFIDELKENTPLFFFQIPFFVALYLYAYKEKNIWLSVANEKP